MFKTKIPPPLYALATALLVYAVHRFLSVPMGFPVAVGGWMIASVGLILIAWAGMTFRRAHTTINPTVPSRASRLVTEGPFRFTRNPMYLGLALMLTGWALWLNNWVGLLGTPLFVGMVTILQISSEEQALRSRFGEDYISYQRRVHRWFGPVKAVLPRLNSKRK